MPELKGIPGWFLGANAPKGYFSRFDQLFTSAPCGRCFLIKGGPGTGKSTAIKKAAALLFEKDKGTEIIYCSADTNSLDAVISGDGKISVADATNPHAAEPKYPGIYETTVSFCDCWDEGVLRENGEKAAELFDLNRKSHEEARRYIAAAANLFEEAMKLETEAVHVEKIIKTALKICIKEFGKRRREAGTEKIRFLSAVTDKGVLFLDETPKILCKKIYFIEDEAGAASKIFMNTVRKAALEYGFDIITCRCPIFPTEKTEHIFIPSAGLGFMTVNKRHKTDIIPDKIIHSGRFCDEKKLAKRKIRIKFALRFGEELIEKAAECMKEAKIFHDELESIYKNAMDFSLADKKTEEMLEKIR